jgi:hypothetical protein
MRFRGFVRCGAPVVLAGSLLIACDDDSGGSGSQQVVRSEVLLVVENESSPVDLIEATEERSVAFGVDGDAVLLEATEFDGGSRSVSSSGDGDDLLIEAEEFQVRFEDDDGDGTGRLALLTGKEDEVAVQEDVTLAGSETTSLKQIQFDNTTVDGQLQIVAEELLTGRWNAAVQAAINLASSTGLDATAVRDSLVPLLEDLNTTLASVRDLLAQSDTDNELPEGVNSRPSLFRVPASNGAFATNFNYDDTLVFSERAALRSFFTGVAQELSAFVAGREFDRQLLPDVLLDVDGYSVDLADPATALRFRLNWDELADLDLYVITPNGSVISYENEIADGGELDIDNTSGGLGATENVIFDEVLFAGDYLAFVEYFGGDVPADFELTGYLNGRIVARLRGTLEPTTTIDNDQSDRIRVTVELATEEPIDEEPIAGPL